MKWKYKSDVLFIYFYEYKYKYTFTKSNTKEYKRYSSDIAILNMTNTLLTTLYKDLNLPKELKGTLVKCLGVEIPVEIKEKVDTNNITIQIENAFSGLIYLQEPFNKNNTIKQMKEQVKMSLENKKEVILYDFHFYNEKRE